jgi:hypothetical protein
VVMQNAGFYLLGLGLCFALKACWFRHVFALFWFLFLLVGLSELFVLLCPMCSLHHFWWDIVFGV